MAVSFIAGGNRYTLRKPPTCHKPQTLSHNVVSSTPLHDLDLNSTLTLVEQELLTLPEHLNSPPGFNGVRVARSYVFCVVFCRSLFIFLSFFLLVIVFSVLYFWSLCFLSFTFGHCVVCPLLLVIVLSVLYFWSLCCLSFTFGHCVVCPLLLVIVLSVLYFWSLCCMSFTFGHCVVCRFTGIMVVPLISSNSH